MGVKISRILHAGYVFESAGTQIAFDPIFENPFSGNCYAFPSVEFDQEQIKKLRFAAVFISHFHDDHCSLESLDLLDRATPIFIYCVFDEVVAMIKALGFSFVQQIDLNVPVTVGPFEIIPRRALDADVDSIFHIKVAGLNILNVVDSWIDQETLDLLSRNTQWDMILWPFQTMRELEVITPSRALPASGDLPEEWIEQLRILNPKYVVPSSCQFVQESWSWYNHALFPITYKQFEKEVKTALPNAKIVRLNPSVAIELSMPSIERATPLPWIKPVGPQDVDYEYHPDMKPPTTAEVAKRFAPLTSEQRQKVLDYCEDGLLEKYRSMDLLEDGYFNAPRRWKLSVYDHLGKATDFFYKIASTEIERDQQQSLPVSWLTEVPISKIYNALELGESLTSMYMRINDDVFSPSIENDVKDIDIVEDPLIRCLFTGTLGAYQLAQLKRIQARGK